MTLIATPTHRFALLLAAAVLAAAALAAVAGAATLGFHDRFNDGTTGAWIGGSAGTNPGTGGVGGEGDGFLQISVPGPTPGNLGLYSTDPAYQGNWIAAGITQVQLWLKDVGTANAGLEMHVCLGNGAAGNFWQSNTGLIPPTTGWQQFTVDVTNGANFTFIGSTNSGFTAALQGVDRLLLRHDKAPYTKFPDTIIGDVGVDEVLLTNGTAGVGDARRVAAGDPVRLERAAPNPSRGGVAFRLESPAGEPVHVQVVDAMGRVVRHEELQGADGGVTWQWDGADDRGVRMAPGYYRARAWSRFGGMSQPIVRID